MEDNFEALARLVVRAISLVIRKILPMRTKFSSSVWRQAPRASAERVTFASVLRLTYELVERTNRISRPVAVMDWMICIWNLLCGLLPGSRPPLGVSRRVCFARLSVMAPPAGRAQFLPSDVGWMYAASDHFFGARPPGGARGSGGPAGIIAGPTRGK